MGTYKIKHQDENQTRWNQKGTVPVEFEFEDAEFALIKKSFDELDQKGKVTVQLVELYEKFS